MRRIGVVAGLVSLLLAGCQDANRVSAPTPATAPTASLNMPTMPPALDTPPGRDGTANGVLFDNTSGFLRTDSGATATASLHCNGTRAYVDLKFGVAVPHYYTWRLVDVNTSQYVGNWLPLTQPTGYNAGPFDITVTRGGWLLVAGIFHQANGQWNIDAEYMVVDNSYAVHKTYCLIE